VYDNVPSALPREDLASALQIQPVATSFDLDNNAHGLPLGRERDHLPDLRAVPRFLEGRPLELLRELQERRLRLAADKYQLFGLRVDILKSGRVDSDRLVEELPECGGKDRVELGLVDGKVVVWVLAVLRVEATIGVIAAVCVGARAVVLELTNEFGVDADGTRDDRHRVLRERAGLVGADDGGLGYGIGGAENANQKLLVCQALSRECER